VSQADGANAVRRVSHRAAQLAHLDRPLHARKVDPGRARLEQAVDEPAGRFADPRERREAAREGMTDERERLRLGELGMLEVDDDEVESRLGCEVDDLGSRELDEEAPNSFAEIQHL
jgi:hypothetical protein